MPDIVVGAARQYLARRADMVNRYLETLLPETTRPQRLFAAMNYSLLSGGKRLRPVLCIATAECFSVSAEDVLPSAAAIEMVHAYSLIHDDLPAMDNDDLRRGRPTNHKVYGEAVALLAGDALLTQAFAQLSRLSALSPEKRLRLVSVLADAAGPYGMVAGQVVDMEQEKAKGTEIDLEFIHRHKTGKLITASVVMGGLHADVPGDVLDRLEIFGQHLGLGYQMVDDLLDVTATSEQLGKTAGKDIVAGKLTYPMLIGLAETRKRLDETLKKALDTLNEIGLAHSHLADLAELLIHRAF